MGNLAFAGLGVALVPFMDKKTANTPAYPTFRQVWAYTKWKVAEKFNFRWWYKTSRGPISAYVPMSGAVKRAVERDQEKLAKRLFEYVHK